MQKSNEKLTQQHNEGEGNRTAAREYNQSQQRFVQSGKVENKARQAERDIKSEDIRRELENAEAVGRRHAAGEDPEIRRSYKKD